MYILCIATTILENSLMMLILKIYSQSYRNKTQVH